MPVTAADNLDKSICVLFAQGVGNSIRLNSQYISMNGDVVTNGSFTSISNNEGIHGNVYENQENSMIDYHAIIEELYFNDNEVT